MRKEQHYKLLNNKSSNRKWLLCPICFSKTRLQIQYDTIIKNFPLFCPKCKRETIIHVHNLQVTIAKEPDA
ncbi:cysteine-rich KTR domain-containing protein [Pusillibacter faecalis]|uniref:cysteine-rich KTR domain-containing protein n=1 Tax=Oscillospiraceae TaxID=216572 RepID=UPI001BCCCB55|nr:cysteine-rich KTR domain-containing protein [Pusillibacter faecalis]